MPMTTRAMSLFIAGLLWLGTTPAAHAESQASEVRAFVQSFYDWHAVRKRPLEETLRERSDAFGAGLRRAMADGVDFDPFINGDTRCDRYTAGEPLNDGGIYRVNVYSPCFSADQEMPDVIAIVTQEGGRWRFANFEYPEDGNLIEMLRQAAESRN